MSGIPEAASVQLQDEVGREGGEKMLSSADFCKEITPQEALAMKANLSLPWKKLRIMSIPCRAKTGKELSRMMFLGTI